MLQDDQSAGGNGAGEGYAYYPGGKSIFWKEKRGKIGFLVFTKYYEQEVRGNTGVLPQRMEDEATGSKPFKVGETQMLYFF